MLHLVFQTTRHREIQIFHGTGALILKMEADNKSLDISLRDIHSGLYFLRTSDGATAKFRKE